MEDSIRFADQSKALWLQQNLTGSGLGSAELLSDNNNIRYSTIPKKDGCMDRLPFASIIATIITACGVGVFCGCLYKALSITINMITTAFKLELQLEWVKVLQTIVIIISTVMGSLTLILLVVGCLSTGATRSHVYTGFRSRLGGRISTGFFSVIVYILFLVWSAVTLILVVPLIFYYVLMKQCEYKQIQINTHSQNKFDECLSLRNYGITLSNTRNSICNDELIQFCNQGKEAGPLYIAGFAASALIVLGLVHYLCCLVANYAHIKDGIKLKDYEEAIKEELDLRCEMAAAGRKKGDL